MSYLDVQDGKYVTRKGKRCPIEVDLGLRITPHFTVREMLYSQIANRLEIDNRPTDQEIIQNMKAFSRMVLEPIRATFGPFSPGSGYRCPELNKALASKATSDHILGFAGDLKVIGTNNWRLAQWCQVNLRDFNQLILEHHTLDDPMSGWVHISFRRRGGNKREVLTITPEGKELAGLP